jgi:hypothetical protein
MKKRPEKIDLFVLFELSCWGIAFGVLALETFVKAIC